MTDFVPVAVAVAVMVASIFAPFDVVVIVAVVGVVLVCLDAVPRLS